MRARAGPPYQVQRHLSGTSAEQRFHRLPQHLHASSESVAVHLRSGLGKPGQTPGGVHLVHQVSRRRRRRTGRRRTKAGPGTAEPGPDRAPPDWGRTGRRRTGAGPGARPPPFPLRHLFFLMFFFPPENATSSAWKQTKRFRPRVGAPHLFVVDAMKKI
jgi:hypothetical protein